MTIYVRPHRHRFRARHVRGKPLDVSTWLHNSPAPSTSAVTSKESDGNSWKASDSASVPRRRRWHKRLKRLRDGWLELRLAAAVPPSATAQAGPGNLVNTLKACALDLPLASCAPGFCGSW